VAMQGDRVHIMYLNDGQTEENTKMDH